MIRPDCENGDYPGLGSGESLNAFTGRRLKELPGRYRRLANAFRNTGVRPARVFPSHYPSADESVWLFNSLLVPLDSAISDASRDNGWTVTPGARKAFTGRGYCAPAATRWVVTKSEAVANQGNDAGTLHPNPAGHQAMAAVASRFIKRELFPNGQARAADWVAAGTKLAEHSPAARNHPRALRRPCCGRLTTALRRRSCERGSITVGARGHRC